VIHASTMPREGEPRGAPCPAWPCHRRAQSARLRSDERARMLSGIVGPDAAGAAARFFERASDAVRLSSRLYERP
jgi:hypothetical protein